VRFNVLFQYLALIVFAVLGILAVLLDTGSVYVVAFFTFASVVCTAFLISWAAEASEFSVSRGLALAVVAIVQTLPEFFVEGTIAWKAGKDLINWEGNVIANFTGANRLLTGLGWPLILITLAIQRRRKPEEGGSGPTVVKLRGEQSIEVLFLLVSSLWYLVVLLKGTLTFVDTVVLGTIFVLYLWLLSKLPSEKEDPQEVLAASPLALVELEKTRHRVLAIGFLFTFSGLIFLLITDPFVNSIAELAKRLLGAGSVFFFLQWIAPFLSEFPEKVTAFNWARRVKLAPMALLNLVSSSVSELTVLVAIIPVIFSLSLGGVGTIHVSAHWVEILLTMAQSLYACASLLDLEYNMRTGSTLFVLWAVSTAFVDTRLAISVLFLLLAGLEVVVHRRKIVVFKAFRETLAEYVQLGH
jgi:cation:H+ antiporter